MNKFVFFLFLFIFEGHCLRCVVDLTSIGKIEELLLVANQCGTFYTNCEDFVGLSDDGYCDYNSTSHITSANITIKDFDLYWNSLDPTIECDVTQIMFTESNACFGAYDPTLIPTKRNCSIFAVGVSVQSDCENRIIFYDGSTCDGAGSVYPLNKCNDLSFKKQENTVVKDNFFSQFSHKQNEYLSSAFVTTAENPPSDKRCLVEMISGSSKMGVILVANQCDTLTSFITNCEDYVGVSCIADFNILGQSEFGNVRIAISDFDAYWDKSVSSVECSICPREYEVSSTCSGDFKTDSKLKISSTCALSTVDNNGETEEFLGQSDCENMLIGFPEGNCLGSGVVAYLNECVGDEDKSLENSQSLTTSLAYNKIFKTIHNKANKQDEEDEEEIKSLEMTLCSNSPTFGVSFVFLTLLFLHLL